MDGQQYLQQISESNRPVVKTAKKRGISGILSSKFFKIGAIGLLALILIIIIGSIIGGAKGDEKTLDYALKLHLDNTIEIIQEFQPSVKSSDLRSSSASLQGVLFNTSAKLTTYMTNEYEFNEKNISEDLIEEAASAKDDLYDELFEAKINGILDRIYAHKMAYEISLITAEEAKILKSTDNEELSGLLNESYDSLTNLYDKFTNFSETKN